MKNQTIAKGLHLLFSATLIAMLALSIGINVPDAFSEIDLPESPDSLAVGETATFTAVVQVTSFDKNEPRLAWVLTRVHTFPDFRIDPNPENNSAEASIRIIGRDKSCF